jgi:hypothetical protein
MVPTSAPNVAMNAPANDGGNIAIYAPSARGDLDIFDV